jgi:hypothetical protein
MHPFVIFRWCAIFTAHTSDIWQTPRAPMRDTHIGHFGRSYGRLYDRKCRTVKMHPFVIFRWCAIFTAQTSDIWQTPRARMRDTHIGNFGRYGGRLYDRKCRTVKMHPFVIFRWCAIFTAQTSDIWQNPKAPTRTVSFIYQQRTSRYSGFVSEIRECV